MLLPGKLSLVNNLDVALKGFRIKPSDDPFITYMKFSKKLTFLAP